MKIFDIFKKKHVDYADEFGCGFCGYFELPIRSGRKYSKIFHNDLVALTAGCLKMDGCPLRKRGGIEH